MKLNIRRVRDNADLPLPAYQSPHSSGMDLRADVRETITLKPLERTLVPTGIAIEVPPGFEAQVRARSGLALKNGVALVNAPGTIDADYRGEVGVILVNLGAEDFVIRRGDRIAQMVITAVTHPILVETVELAVSDRGSGGFGSTGV